MDLCPVCRTASPHEREKDLPGMRYACPRCGTFVLWDTLALSVAAMSVEQRSVLSHRIRRRQKGDGRKVWLVTDEINDWQLNEALPNIQEAVDDFILWVGETQGSVAGQRITLDVEAAAAWIGLSLDDDSRKFFAWLFLDPQFAPLVEYDASRLSTTPEPAVLVTSMRLTMAGWARYDELKRRKVESRTAFMAMQFGDSELDKIVNTYFKPAALAAGFELRLITDRQPAGLIDDQLRVGLRRARFVVADLTHGNHGAYWEAGFAEGLGRPVIYTCRQHEWDEGGRKTHFDTNHLLTVIWDLATADDAAKRLTATIRATLPGEAKLEDE
jgi:hypothetical protein